MEKARRLRLNASKTQIMWLGSIHQLKQIRDIPVLLTSVKVVDTARDLGDIIDSQLSLSAHVALLCRAGSGNCQLRQLRPLICSLSSSTETVKTLVQALISSGLDHCNSLLHGLPDTLLSKLQSCTTHQWHAKTRP